MKNKKIWMQNASETFLIVLASGILFILFIPISPACLDLLLIINFSWALTILLITFYIEKPLGFSTFPALLLIATLFRLALNISATRLILSHGNAGKVIEAIGHYVIQDNYVMGLVVFLILIIVQFIVVTSGAQRIAEVAARFTLDSMPGKQMSIDADLNIGTISQEEAKIRRAYIEKEANFYGAMDGASKFVKGDAIAGILIILVDIIGGFAIGLLQKNLSLSASLKTYTLLTVGDGLVTQIPALIISTATGIIVTRAATDTHLGSEVAKQISAYPKSLIIVCLSLICLLFLQGIPTAPVVILLGFFLTAAVFALKKHKEHAQTTADNLYEKIRIHPLEIRVNKELYNTLSIHQESLEQTIHNLREKLALDLGIIVPNVPINPDQKMQYPLYQILVQGISSGSHPLYFDKILALLSKRNTPKHPVLNGIAVRDPSFGLPALWIETSDKQAAADAGYTLCEPLMVLTTHVHETIQAHLHELLTREETSRLLKQAEIKALRDELIPSLLSLSQVQRILQNLLQEKVSIRHITQILELLLEHAKKTPEPEQLTELIRSGIATIICQKLLNHENYLHVLTLDTALEQKLNQNMNTQHYLTLEPSMIEHLIKALAARVEEMINARKRPILLCSSLLRKPIKQLTQRVIPHLTVLSMNEIPIHAHVESFGVIH